MKRFVLGLAVLACLAVVSQPVLAQCGVTKICVTIPPGSTADEVKDLVDAAWDLGDYSCSSTVQDGTVRVTAETGEGTRDITFTIPGTFTNAGHTIELQFTGVPLRNNDEHGKPPFLVVANFDGQGDVFLPEGTTTLALDFQVIVDTVENNNNPPSSGGGGATPTGFPAMGELHGAIYVLGLLAVGVGYVVFRRSF